MQCSFGTSPGSNDEAVCFIDSVESHVPEEDDTRNVDMQIGRASNASEPSLQAMAGADWGFNLSTNLVRCERFLSHGCLFSHVIEDILLKQLNSAEGFMRWPSMSIHQLLNQTIRGLSDRGVNGIDDFVAPRECIQP